MIITNIEYQKRNKERVNLYIDEKYYTSISVNSVLKLGLRKGYVLSQDVYTKIKEIAIYDYLLMRATNYLLKYRKTEKQLFQYLFSVIYKNKGKLGISTQDIKSDTTKATVNEIILHSNKLTLLNDSSYAYDYINSLKQKFGVQIIIKKLYEKGLGNDTNIEMISSIQTEKDIEEGVRNNFYKKFKKDKINTREPKEVRYILSKGYSFENIKNYL